MTETSGDSAWRVSEILFCGSGILFRTIHESFTTQGLPPKRAKTSQFGPRRLLEWPVWLPGLKPKWDCGVDRFYRSR